MEYPFCCGGSGGLAPRHYVVIQCLLDNALAISILMILHILYACALVLFLPTCQVDRSTG